MASRNLEVYQREKTRLIMQYTPTSFFVSTWLGSVMNLKLYSMCTSCIAFWVVALPNPTWGSWFQWVCMQLVLTMFTATWGYFLAAICGSAYRAMIVHVIISFAFLISSGAIVDIGDHKNLFLEIISYFSPLRFCTEKFQRTIMESNNEADIDA